MDVYCIVVVPHEAPVDGTAVKDDGVLLVVPGVGSDSDDRVDASR